MNTAARKQFTWCQRIGNYDWLKCWEVIPRLASTKIFNWVLALGMAPVQSGLFFKGSSNSLVTAEYKGYLMNKCCTLVDSFNSWRTAAGDLKSGLRWGVKRHTFLSWVQTLDPPGGFHVLFEVCLNCWAPPVKFMQCETLWDLADNKFLSVLLVGVKRKLHTSPSRQQCILSAWRHTSSLWHQLRCAHSEEHVTLRLEFELNL